ncbi:MAG: 16S rRNA (guanine(527)-N(7))-methyltransferase RsmG [Clostridia bacterium]
MKILADFIANNFASVDAEKACALFEKYYDILTEWNGRFNLTAITEKPDVEIKHFVDSAIGGKFIQAGQSVCDIGCGAGFPSIPLAILMPDTRFCLVDSLDKRIKFIEAVVEELQLTNCEFLHSRAEDFAIANRETFDVCVARAVAPMPTLLEYTIPLLKVGGKLVAYKGANAGEELNQCDFAFKELGCAIDEIFNTRLPNNDERALCVIKKTRKTNEKYPRGQNKARLAPLTK